MDDAAKGSLPATPPDDWLEGFPAHTREAWEELATSALRGREPRSLNASTLDGLLIDVLADQGVAPHEPVAQPGTPPLTRGATRPSDEARRWRHAFAYRHPDPRVVADQISEDHPFGLDVAWIHTSPACRTNGASGLVERTTWDDLGGTHLNAKNVAEFLSRTPDTVGIAIDAGANSSLVTTLDEQGSAERDIAVWLDPFGALATHGAVAALDASVEQAVRAGTHVDARPLCCGLTWQSAGALPVDEIALSVAAGVAWLRSGADAGVALDELSSRLLFRVGVGRDFFLEIAKFRALRTVWHGILEACGVHADDRTIEIVAATSLCTETRRDAHTNLLRATTQSCAAALGGADAIGTRAFSEAWGHPDQFARRIALNIQNLLSEESHLHRVIDPTGGSWLVESLTSQLVALSWKRFQEIEERGGLLAALRDGWIASALSGQATKRWEAVRTGKIPIVGVTAYPPTLAESPPATVPETDAEEDRDLPEPNDVESLSDESAVTLFREAEPFEALWQRVAERPTPPRAAVVGVGSLAQNKARADFARSFLRVAAFEVHGDEAHASASDAAEAFKRDPTTVVVLVAPDADYPGLVPELAPRLRAAGATRILLAGRPTTLADNDAASLVDGYCFRGCDALTVLESALDAAGA